MPNTIDDLIQSNSIHDAPTQSDQTQFNLQSSKSNLLPLRSSVSEPRSLLPRSINPAISRHWLVPSRPDQDRQASTRTTLTQATVQGLQTTEEPTSRPNNRDQFRSLYILYIRLRTPYSVLYPLVSAVPTDGPQCPDPGSCDTEKIIQFVDIVPTDSGS